MRYLLTLAILYLACPVASQVAPEREVDLSTLADDLLPYQDSDANFEELYENLAQLLSQPIELNSATYENLRAIPFLSEKQIQHFLYHREVHGKLISIYELQSIPEFDDETIEKIRSFVRVNDPSKTFNRSFLKAAIEDGNTYLITRYIKTLERKAGFNEEDEDRKFAGLDGNLYVRFRSSKPGAHSLGFTADQDAGEEFKWKVNENQFGFDHVSVHAQVLNRGKVKNLILGDFQCQFGQGLILGGGFGMGKGAETITTVRKNSFGFVPYTSLNEAGFLRGAATTVKIGKYLSLSSFYSRALRDASITGGDTASSVSSFLYSGLHRNRNELSKRKQVAEENIGAVLEYRTNGLTAGVISNRIHFSQEIVKAPNAYNQFAFQGNANTNLSIYANCNFYNYNFFTEIAHSLEAGSAIIGGMIISPHPRIDLSILYRRFDQDYYTFYSNAFAESSTIQNERGLYWGWKYQWKKRFTASGYTDMFTFPWLGFRRYAPSSTGHEWLIRLNYQPSKKIGMFAQMREETKERNSSEAGVVYTTSRSTKRNYAINFDYSIHPNIRLQTRAQISTFSFEEHESTGSVLLQDFHFAMGRLKLTTRYAIFDARNFDNRQYVYENDVWLAYSMPAYEGVGIRNFIVIQYKISNAFTIWARYARTKYSDRDEIGSGLEMIKGNVKNDIKLQARISL
jgi:hypothetical protein